MRLQGFTPQRVYAVYILSTDKRVYLLWFSAEPEVFAVAQPVIEEILDSFEAL